MRKAKAERVAARAQPTNPVPQYPEQKSPERVKDDEDWRKGNEDAWIQYANKRRKQPELTITATLRKKLAIQAKYNEDNYQNSPARKAGNMTVQTRERITDNFGKDIAFRKPNGDRLKDPHFVKTVVKAEGAPKLDEAFKSQKTAKSPKINNLKLTSVAMSTQRSPRDSVKSIMAPMSRFNDFDRIKVAPTPKLVGQLLVFQDKDKQILRDHYHQIHPTIAQSENSSDESE